MVWCNSSLISENCLYRDIITKWAFGAGLKFLRWRGACSFCKHFKSQFNWMTSDSSSFQWENQSLHFLFFMHMSRICKFAASSCSVLPVAELLWHVSHWKLHTGHAANPCFHLTITPLKPHLHPDSFTRDKRLLNNAKLLLITGPQIKKKQRKTISFISLTLVLLYLPLRTIFSNKSTLTNLMKSLYTLITYNISMQWIQCDIDLYVKHSYCQTQKPWSHCQRIKLIKSILITSMLFKSLYVD